MAKIKVGRNDPCPCGAIQKHKHCCEGKVDWNEILRTGVNPVPYLSVRGRNLYFLQRLAEILQLDTELIGGVSEYKKAFTTNAVREIHETILEVWPPTTDLQTVLGANTDEVSSLYIGDYQPEYLTRSIVRQSIYTNKILIVDPFVYPRSVRDEYNPILNPAQYRAQTLKNANFWFSLMPWIDLGIVELIVTPGDLDRKLNWESLKRQQKKFDETEELKKASLVSVDELKSRHMMDMMRQQLLLGAPDSYIRKMFDDLPPDLKKVSFDDFLKHVNQMREDDIDFLEPLGTGEDSAQIHMISSGTSYDIALLTAQITRSYLVTDLYVKWREIEIDRESQNPESKVWSPFAKSFQSAPLRFLNNLSLSHALQIRSEGRLRSLRDFLLRVWKQAQSTDPFDEENAILLADELSHEVSIAENDWKQIDRDLVKIVGAELGTGLLAAGPLIAAGHGYFLAGAAAVAGAINVASSTMSRKSFPDRYPASFFMKIDNTN